MVADEFTVREMWLVVARAAAEHRWVTEAGDGIFYGDLTLRESADARAWAELTRAIRRAADARVGEEEIVDAVLKRRSAARGLGGDGAGGLGTQPR